MKIKKEDIIKKLFESECSLKPEERAALNNYEYVNDTFHRQWEEMSEEAVDLVREEKILNGIMEKVRGPRFPLIRKSFHKYGVAAMIAVCMILSTLLFMKNTGEAIIYVVHTGYKSMDSVRLADGTKVMLNAGSRLTYPKEFSGEKREVQLSGQAFFDVTPDKKHPFIVKTQKMDVTVLGTSFEVFSYDGDEEGETVLLTGKVKVEVFEDSQQKGGSYILKPNEKLTYSKTDGISLTTIDADAYSSWRQGKRMSFKNETLEMILERLEKWYGQKIECDPRIAKHYRFTFAVHSESLDLILNYISHSAPLNYRLISNDHYIIEEVK
ncbi:FecR family protein [Phocaeicola sp.]